MPKIAIITGVTGQDGSYLAEFLLEKGYIVHGIKRRSSVITTHRLNTILNHKNFKIHYGDLTDSLNITNIIKETQPDEIYNLAAQSDVAISFECPEYTTNVNALGTLRILESIRTLGLVDKTRYYQASTSELYGDVLESPQTETTPFNPQSPYGISKLYAYWTTINYRNSYGMYACNGILFNHESPRRGENFVTRKITKGLTNISKGKQSCLYLGNLNALRDWGHSKDFIKMQWLMLQQEIAKDYVIATGQQISIREFVEKSVKHIGIKLKFIGEGIEEYGIVTESNNPNIKINDIIIRVDPKYYRPSEVESLLGNSELARKDLGWVPTITIDELCEDMMKHDLNEK